MNLFGLENEHGHGSNAITLPKVFAPELALKFTWSNQNVLRQSQGCRFRSILWPLGFAANATGGRNGSVYHVTTLSDPRFMESRSVRDLPTLATLKWKTERKQQRADRILRAGVQVVPVLDANRTDDRFPSQTAADTE